MHYQLAQDQFLLTMKEKGKELVGTFTIKDGRILRIQSSEVVRCTTIRSLTPQGNLDYDLLKHMGSTKARLEKHDALFFWQLLFPICDLAKSGIRHHGRPKDALLLQSRGLVSEVCQ
jgi:hypothetical protein